MKPTGPSLLVNLHVGTDSGPFSDRFGGTAPNRQLRGRVDDLVVLGRVLSPVEIRRLSQRGATTLFGNPRQTGTADER